MSRRNYCMEENYLRKRWRNKLFKFMAGGYEGCLCHPAALIVDGDGDVHLVGSDGGRGGLDENGWYCRVMRSFLDKHNVCCADHLLTGPHRDPDAYRLYLEEVHRRRAEQRRRERDKVAEALEKEIIRMDDSGWDHEFEEHDISTPEKVREVCEAMCHAFHDMCYPAHIADALVEAGYDGAGVVCSDCGKYFESTDYECFSDCVDQNAYHGIGGLAVAYTRIVCDDCRHDSECPVCFDLSLPKGVDVRSGHACDHMTFDVEFGYLLTGVCECCWNHFVFEHDDGNRGMTRLGHGLKISDILSDLEDAALEWASTDKSHPYSDDYAKSAAKYYAWRLEEGKTRDEIIRTLDEQVLLWHMNGDFTAVSYPFARKIVENAIGKIAKEFWRFEDPMCNWEPEDTSKEWDRIIEYGRSLP